MGAIPRLRLLAVLAVGMLSSVAFANGAMGLALEMFEYQTWTVYVVATVILEAWFIGVKRGVGWPKSLGISVLANFVTAFVCPMCCVPFLHWSWINPNPPLYTFQLLASFGLISAVIEACVWAPKQPLFPKPCRESVLCRSMVAHAIGVPLAMVILLFPSHPYQGFQGTVGYQRRMKVLEPLMRDFPGYCEQDGKIPKFISVEDLIRRSTNEHVRSVADAWVAGYVPDYQRFDLGEKKRWPIECNKSIMGYEIGKERSASSGLPEETWLIRYRLGQFATGYLVNLDDGDVRRSSDPKELGFEK